MKINYEIFKSAKKNAETLVLVPGSGEGINRFRPDLDKLTKEFKVVVFDNPGIGETPLPKTPFLAEELAVEYQTILTAIGIESYHLLGHSFGGFTVQYMANNAKDKVKKLVVVSMGPGGADNQSKILTYQMDFANKGFYSLFGTKFRNENETFMQEYVEEKKNISRPVAGSYIISSLRNSTYQLASGIKTPTLIIQGEDDQIVIPENGKQLAKLMDNSRYLGLKGVGHYPYIEDSSVWNKVIDFLINDANIGEVLEKDLIVTERMIDEERKYNEATKADDFPAFMAELFLYNQNHTPEESVNKFRSKVTDE